jgi:DNA (cytosine-5)-methyltransferase 1
VVHGGRRRCVGRAARVLTVGSLFSGIGGFDLGFERAGMRTVWFCEQDPFCQRVLGKHWPGVPVYPDVRALVADTDGGGWPQPQSGEAGDRHVHADARLPREHDGAGGLVPVRVPSVDVLAGGFPCQDISTAGRGAGIDGARSGLWGEYARLIRDLRPRYVVVENVAALLARGMERVLGDLAACGYDAEWDCIPASAVGAPHRRDRVWLVAYAQSDGRGPGRARRPLADRSGEPVAVRSLQDVAYPARDLPAGSAPAGTVGKRARAGRERGAVAHTAGEGRGSARPVRSAEAGGAGPFGEPARSGWWFSEPDVGRVAHGVPARVDRLRSLGNALVPQIAEWIGRRIMADAGL